MLDIISDGVPFQWMSLQFKRITLTLSDVCLLQRIVFSLMVFRPSLQTFQNFQNQWPFGLNFWELGEDEMVLGRKFAEGRHAETFEAVSTKRFEAYVDCILLKVFKKGSSFQVLQLQWPRPCWSLFRNIYVPHRVISFLKLMVGTCWRIEGLRLK